MTARNWVLGALAAAWGLSAGCANTRDIAGRVDADAGAPTFTNADAATAETPEGGLIEYCPSSSCSEPYTTCPGSRFACDVNLSNDPDNCGACGVACPTVQGLNGKFQCVGGKCVLACSSGTSASADCDGIPDNGCEILLGTSDNCTACGDKCPTDNPCVRDLTNNTAKCGCDAGLTYCSTAFPNRCIDTENDDAHCGTCRNACPAQGDGGPRPPRTRYGCAAGECGVLKCEANYADCDGDLADPNGNGCETYLLSTDTCGRCDVTCDPGQGCALEYSTQQIKCMCAPGQKNCGTVQSPVCVDVANDVFNCGGCGITCNAYFTASGLSLSHFTTACDSGSCSLGCESGWADCNGRLDDGCEVNTNADPENCGGCGIVCDGVAGQACVGGRCALEPCDTNEPGAK